MLTQAKRCSRCGEEKLYGAFGVRTAAPDRLQVWCRECHNAYRRGWHRDNPQRARAVHVRRNYGLSVEAYEALLIAQSGRCAVCEDVLAEPCVDHCHTTGVVRGLLCHNCNRAIGLLKDSSARARAAAAYLEQ